RRHRVRRRPQLHRRVQGPRVLERPVADDPVRGRGGAAHAPGRARPRARPEPGPARAGPAAGGVLRPLHRQHRRDRHDLADAAGPVGRVSLFLGTVGLEALPQWFASSRWALPALVLVTVWAQAGYANLIYLSALQDAPAQLYEAAQIDGAGRWRTFRTITWPSLLPTTIFLLVTLFVGISQT